MRSIYSTFAAAPSTPSTSRVLMFTWCEMTVFPVISSEDHSVLTTQLTERFCSCFRTASRPLLVPNDFYICPPLLRQHHLLTARSLQIPSTLSSLPFSFCLSINSLSVYFGHTPSPRSFIILVYLPFAIRSGLPFQELNTNRLRFHCISGSVWPQPGPHLCLECIYSASKILSLKFSPLATVL